MSSQQVSKSAEQAMSLVVCGHFLVSNIGTYMIIQDTGTQAEAMFSFTTSAEQAVAGFVGDRYLSDAGTHATMQRTQTEDVITSTRQLLCVFGLRLSHLARTFDAFQYSVTVSGFDEKIPACWQVVHRLSRHMQPLVQLIIELSPLFGDFTGIIQLTLDHLSFPPSLPPSTPTPTSQTLRTLEYAIRHILQQSRLHINAMFSISDTASEMKLPEISPRVDSCYSDWLSYFMCIDDDLNDLSRLLNNMFSIAANISETIPYVPATHPIL